MTDRSALRSAIAALVIIAVFAGGAYVMPSVVLALGDISPLLAIAAVAVFVLAFFAVFWLRGRFRGG